MIVDPVYALTLLVLGVLLMFVIPVKNEIETWLDRKKYGEERTVFDLRRELAGLDTQEDKYSAETKNRNEHQLKS